MSFGCCASCVTHTLHNTAKRIENSLRCEVLRGNQVDEVLLALLLLQHDHGKLQSRTAAWWREPYLLDDLIDGRIGLLKVLREHLWQCQTN